MGVVIEAQCSHSSGISIRSFSTGAGGGGGGGGSDPSGRTWSEYVGSLSGSGSGSGSQADRSWVEYLGGENKEASQQVDTTTTTTTTTTEPTLSAEPFPDAVTQSSSVSDVVINANETTISQSQPIVNAVVEAAASITDSAAAQLVLIDPPGFLSGSIMKTIDHLHIFADIPYWQSIIAVTVVTRIFLLPIALKTVQASARMALMKPHMERVKDAMMNDPNKSDPRTAARYQNEYKAMFLKYKVNPIRSILWPLAQFPIFIGFFWALKDMGLHYPELATGGALWFTNLTIADASYVLPVFNSLSFLAMIELGSDGLPQNKQGQFKWIMRGLAGAMIPMTASLPQGLFVYWAANNSISIAQTMALKNKDLKKALDIPEPPPADPHAVEAENPFETMKRAYEENKARSERATAEIIDGKSPVDFKPPPPPPTLSDKRKRKD